MRCRACMRRAKWWGLYYGKYPGGAGLTPGSVFGRIAGREAARAANGPSD